MCNKTKTNNAFDAGKAKNNADEPVWRCQKTILFLVLITVLSKTKIKVRFVCFCFWDLTGDVHFAFEFLAKTTNKKKDSDFWCLYILTY